MSYFDIDGTTILPTFMPVATQAVIKGLTPQQVEQLGMPKTYILFAITELVQAFL